jgi:hypothetical protein
MTGVLLLAAALLTGCAGSYALGYASEKRVICVRWTLAAKGAIADPLECVEELEAP